MNDTHGPAGQPGETASPAQAPVISTTSARAGVTFGTMRWVVVISMAAIVVVLAVLWLSTNR